MPVLDTSIEIPNVPREIIWKTLIDFDQYPHFMADVVDVQWREREALGGVTDWIVLLNGSELSWTERDVFEPMERILFAQTVGDIEQWEGYWLLTGPDDSISVSLHVEFDIGIPSLSDILHPIGARAIKANCRQMLQGLFARSLAA